MGFGRESRAVETGRGRAGREFRGAGPDVELAGKIHCGHGEAGDKRRGEECRPGGYRRGSFNGYGYEHGFGRGRMFGAGGVKLAVLKLLGEEPAHGYQLIKKMEQKLTGGYTPSAGAIYSTLNQLEDEGLIAGTVEENRKMYSVTAEGTKFLESNKAQVEELFARWKKPGGALHAAIRRSWRGPLPICVMRWRRELRGAMQPRSRSAR